MRYAALQLSVALCFTIATTKNTQAQITIGNTTLDSATVVTGLEVPWEITWGPDNWIWMTERYGRVSRVNPENGTQNILLDLTEDVFHQSEAGLLGLTLHPDFEDTAQVFIVYTYIGEGNIKEKLVRYDYDNNKLVNPLTLIDNIPGGSTHDGSRLLILPDYTILMTTGDAQNQSFPQNVSSLAGKTLRLNLDGSIPSDNPFNNSPVWSYGHRNAQGLALAPNGKIYSSEHGPQTDDELNILEKGKNYGWPNVHGYCDGNVNGESTFCNNNSVVEPIYSWTPTIATSDIAWYDHPSIPEFQNTILLSVLKNKRVQSIKLNASGTEYENQSSHFSNYWGRLRDICVAPDGAIYLATNGQSWGSNPTPQFEHTIVKVWNPNYTLSTDPENNIKKNQLIITPNPSKGLVTVTVTKSNELINIFDSKGRLLLSQTLAAQKETLDFSSLQKGIYFINVPSTGAFRKVILE